MRSWPNSACVGTPKISVMRLLHQGAAALFLGTERLIRRNRGADLVVVPGVLRLRRLLHLEQIRRVDLAPVLADAALAEQRIAGGDLLNLLDHLRAIVA